MRIRLFLGFLLVISLSLAGVALIVRQSAQDEIQTFLGRGGLIGAESLVEDLEGWYEENGGWEGVEAVMPRGYSAGGGQEEGEHMSGFRKLATLRIADAERKLIYDPINVDAIGLFIDDTTYSIPLVVGDETIGFLLSQEEGYEQESVQFEERFLERINRASLIAAAISGSAALILAVLLSYFLLKPVKVLVEATEKLASGDLTYRVEIEKPEELARLGRTFNQMAHSLEDAARIRKDLSADIAHELRTPLAVQRAHLEALIDGVFPATEENIITMLEQNQLLNRLVEDLRIITLTDSGELELNLHPLDLSALAASAVEHFSARAREKRIDIHLELGDCGMILADAERIQQILHNLLQNGIRYTPDKGKLILNLTCDESYAVLTLLDTGPGIPEEALPYIFDRFYRAERSRSKEGGGTGLGLAIARNLAEAHNGSLAASNHPAGGAVFTLKLPLFQP